MTAGCRIFSAIQPSGTLTLGNYLGAVRSWVELQESAPQEERLFCVADYHAITVRHEPQELGSLTLGLTMDLLGCGLDPSRSALFLQSQVPEHTELMWILASVTSYGELFEDERSIRQKIRRAVTDPGGSRAAIAPGVENLFRILAETAPAPDRERLERARRDGSLKYADLKEAVAEHLVAALGPLRERRGRVTPAFARDVLAQGAARARALARSTLAEARDRIGILRVGPEDSHAA